jgi:ribA/ribD-fused uncharacterized protein
VGRSEMKLKSRIRVFLGLYLCMTAVACGEGSIKAPSSTQKNQIGQNNPNPAKIVPVTSLRAYRFHYYPLAAAGGRIVIHYRLSGQSLAQAVPLTVSELGTLPKEFHLELTQDLGLVYRNENRLKQFLQGPNKGHDYIARGTTYGGREVGARPHYFGLNPHSTTLQLEDEYGIQGNRSSGFHIGADVGSFVLFEISLVPVDFYHSHEAYYEFTNFYSHPVAYGGQTYPSAEHAFQAQKFQPGSKEALAFVHPANAGAGTAYQLGQAAYPRGNGNIGIPAARYRTRVEWEKQRDAFMYEIVLEKFSQNRELANELLNSGYRYIVEWADHPGGDPAKNIDEYWGTNRHTNQGKNHLGKILMLVRAKLRQEVTQDQISAVLVGLAND